jgi:hypothetical protein
VTGGGATLPPTPGSRAGLADAARRILAAHWQPAGYTVPNGVVYPFQWLWDSCFHALAWVELGEPDRALAELAHLFRTQDADGFVPHVDYAASPDHHEGFWGRPGSRPGSSSITQPPMYGHAVAELARRGVAVPDALAERARAGLAFLLRDRARDPATGLVTLVHPWESGSDDSPRWDDWCPGGFEGERWYRVKGELLGSVVRAPGGAPLANPAFSPAPAGFNALVAFNALELAEVLGDGALRSRADELVDALAARWAPHLRTWVDAGVAPGHPGATGSGAARTLDGLLPALVDGEHAAAALAEALDDDAYGGRFGPAGVHRDEPAFDPARYWRGPAWPQLTYLLWVAARRQGLPVPAADLADRLVAGALASGWAEYWHPDTGQGLGAAPQSWATVALLVAQAP